jgi:hypothetical protein
MRTIRPVGIGSLTFNPRSLRLCRIPPPSRLDAATIIAIGGFATITPSGTTLTKTAWTQALSAAAVTADITLLNMIVANSSSGYADASVVFDIGIGAAGSEAVVAADVPVGSLNASPLPIPVRIPAGTRVAVRVSCVRTSGGIQLYPGAAASRAAALGQTPTSLDVLGNNPASATGTAMTGASGTWTQIVASTAKDYQSLWPIPSLTTGTNNGDLVTYSVGIGAAGSEVVVGQFGIQHNAAQKSCVVWGGNALSAVSGPVPAGSRVAIRHNIASNPANYSAALFGVPYV